MFEAIVFALSRLATRMFWYLVAATFIGCLMMAWRSWARNEIFNAARYTIGKGY